MKILITIPNEFIIYCREQKVPESKISKLCKSYIQNERVNGDWKTSAYLFEKWFEELGGKEELEEL